MEKDNTTLKEKWWYKPDNVWFDNRKQIKGYLGGTKYFNQAMKVKDAVYVIFNNNN